MILIDYRVIHGQRVGWYDDGNVYMTRDLHDSLPEDMQGRLHRCNTPREFAALCRQFAALSALAGDSQAYERAPAYDRRIGRGDDFAGDAWLDRRTGAVRYVAVGRTPAQQAAT